MLSGVGLSVTSGSVSLACERPCRDIDRSASAESLMTVSPTAVGASLVPLIESVDVLQRGNAVDRP